MWKREYSIAVAVILTVLSVYGIYQHFRSEEDKLQERMLDAFYGHDHEEAVIYANQLLELQPEHAEAKKVIHDSGQIFFYLEAAKSTLSAFEDLDSDVQNDDRQIEKIHTGLKTAQDYIAKAKNLDPLYKKSLTFEKYLNEARLALLYVLAVKTVEAGQQIMATADPIYQEASELVDAAADSSYIAGFLPVQSAWALAEKPSESVQEQRAINFKKIGDMAVTVAEYQGGDTQKFVSLMLAYTDSIKTTLTTLTAPKGSYKDFIQSAATTKKDYHNAEKNLKRSIPRSIRIAKSLREAAELRVFSNPSAKQVLEVHESQYKL